MSGGIGVDPPIGVRAELVGALQHGCAELEHLSLVRVDVVDIEVEVELLGVLRPGPAWRPIFVHTLECERRPLEPNHFHPVQVLRLRHHPPAEQLCVELRAYRRLQHVADMLHKQPQVAVLAQWQQLGEFVKEMRAQDAQLLHTRLLTK